MAPTMLSSTVLAASATLSSGKPTGRALLVIDVQDCFSKGGTLPVNGADETFHNEVHDFIMNNQQHYDKIVFSRDHHHDNHISFARTHFPADFTSGNLAEWVAWNGPTDNIVDMTCLKGDRLGGGAETFCSPPMANFTSPIDYELESCTAGADRRCWNTTEGARPDTAVMATVHPTWNTTSIEVHNQASPGCIGKDCVHLKQTLWPVHCVHDSALAAPLQNAFDSINKEIDGKAQVVFKGVDNFVDSYSALNDNVNITDSKLPGILRESDIEEVHVLGLAFDYCVQFSAKSAAARGYKTTVVTHLTKAVVPSVIDTITNELKDSHVTVLDDSESAVQALINEMEKADTDATRQLRGVTTA